MPARSGPSQGEKYRVSLFSPDIFQKCMIRIDNVFVYMRHLADRQKSMWRQAIISLILDQDATLKRMSTNLRTLG